MGNEINLPGTYRVEVSGWGLDQKFFLERTNLLWFQDGLKRIALHYALPDGAIVFIRLVTTESLNASIPVTYQVHAVEPMDSNGLCEMRLTQLGPRFKESKSGEVASKLLEDIEGIGERGCEVVEGQKDLELEEILQ